MVIYEFCERCQWAYESWRTHRVLFDGGPRATKLLHSPSGPALVRLSIIVQEYFLHQIAKLHDRASQQGNICLGIDYIIRFGRWDLATKAKLDALQKELEELNEKIRPARNKILSHNDLETIMNQATLGAFPAEADTAYFKALEEFVNVINGSSGAQWRFKSDVESETNLLADTVAK